MGFSHKLLLCIGSFSSCVGLTLMRTGVFWLRSRRHCPCSSNSLDILHRAWSCCGPPVSFSLAAVCCPFMLCTARCCAPMVHRGPSSGLSGCALLFLDPGGLSPGNFSGWHRPCLSHFPRLSWFIQGPSVRPFGICRFFPFVVFLGFWRPGLYNGLRIGEASNPGPPQTTLHDFSANVVLLYSVRRRPHLPACLRL